MKVLQSFAGGRKMNVKVGSSTLREHDADQLE